MAYFYCTAGNCARLAVFFGLMASGKVGKFVDARRNWGLTPITAVSD